MQLSGRNNSVCLDFSGYLLRYLITSSAYFSGFKNRNEFSCSNIKKCSCLPYMEDTLQKCIG